MLGYFNNYLISGCHNQTAKLQSQCLKENGPRVQLAEVKMDLYNPVRSTLQRNDIENVQGRLSDEHSRSTLPPGMGKFYEKDKFYLLTT